MFVTRNTEYFLVDGLCVAVRDRRTESWLEGHLAVGLQFVKLHQRNGLIVDVLSQRLRAGFSILPSNSDGNIGELNQVSRRVIVYAGREKLRTDGGIEVWPIELFLERLDSNG